MARELLGHMQCPICDFPDGEVKTDRNENPYFFCPDCSQQILTHGKGNRGKKLLEKMRPLVKEEAAPVPVPAEPKEPRRGTTLLG